MTISTRLLALALGGLMGISSTAHAQSSSGKSSRGTAIWTIAGAGGGFGIGLWAGLTKFDDAINSDRKVWTSAVIGAAIGGVGGYLIGRSRAGRSRPSLPSTARPRFELSPLPTSHSFCNRLATGALVRCTTTRDATTHEAVSIFGRPTNTPFGAPAAWRVEMGSE